MGLIAIFWRALSTRISIPCPTWLSWLVELDNPFFRHYRTRVIIEHLVLRPGMNVLDFGCDPGRLTIPIAKTVGPAGKVTAIEIPTFIGVFLGRSLPEDLYQFFQFYREHTCGEV